MKIMRGRATTRRGNKVLNQRAPPIVNIGGRAGKVFFNACARSSEASLQRWLTARFDHASHETRRPFLLVKHTGSHGETGSTRGA